MSKIPANNKQKTALNSDTPPDKDQKPSRGTRKPRRIAQKVEALYVPAYAYAPIRGSVKKQAIFWLVALVFFISFMWIFSSILLPFVVGIALAYFLNPIVHLFEKIGINRLWSTILITLFIVIMLIMALTIFVPLIANQLQQFINTGLPIYINRIQELLKGHDLDLQGNIKNLLSQSADIISSLINSLLRSGKSIMSIISFVVIIPVVAFYILLDWNYMIKAIDSWIPRAHLATVRGIFCEMDRAIARFIRGQGLVCLILGFYYVMALNFVNLNYSLVIGLFIGIISFVPYIGSFSGFLLSVGVAWMQFYPDNWGWIIAVVGIFLFGQFLEGYVLQPKLVGSSIGLHPVWLMFSLVAFGSLFGFTGLLVAVPLAAAVGVLVRFALHIYLSSPMYAGEDAAAREDEKGIENE